MYVYSLIKLKYWSTSASFATKKSKFQTLPEIRRFHHFYMTLVGKPNLHHREVKTDHNTIETNTLWWCRKSSISHTILTCSRQYVHNIEQENFKRVPVWYRPKTLRRLSQKASHNSRVLELGWIMRTLVCEGLGVFIVAWDWYSFLSLEDLSLWERSSLIRVSYGILSL